MVKGKPAITAKTPTTGKAHPTKRSVNKTTAPSPTQSIDKSNKASLLAPIPSCCGCGTLISEDTKALQCDRCSATNAWKCIECLNIWVEVYEALIMAGEAQVPIRWFCEGCDKTVMDKNVNSDGSSSSDKIDLLVAAIEKLMERYENIEKKLETKADVIACNQLDTRMKQLEEKLNNLDKVIDTKFTGLEEHMKKNALTDEELIKAAVYEEINRKREEDKDSDARKDNIILYRVPELKSSSATDRKTSDRTFVNDLCDGVFNMTLEEEDISKMYRLGRYVENEVRPLLVAFRNYEHKERIMSNLKNFTSQPIEKFRRVSVAHDLNPKDREEIKSLIQQAKQEHVDNSDESTENYWFRVVGQGGRRRVIKIKKRN